MADVNKQHPEVALCLRQVLEKAWAEFGIEVVIRFFVEFIETSQRSPPLSRHDFRIGSRTVAVIDVVIDRSNQSILFKRD